MKKKSLIALIGLISILVVTAGCIQGTEKEDQKQFTVKDDLDRNVTVSKEVDRIVSLAPSNTEVLFALGAGPKVVGVTTYADYPSQVKYKETVGGFANPSVEKIISLNPDIVFASTRTGQQVVQTLEDNGIPVYVSNPNSVDDILENIREIGKIVGAKDYASQLTERMNERMKNITDKVDDLEDKEVFYLVSAYGGNIWTAGDKTFINKLLKKSGGENVFADEVDGYKKVSLSTIVKQDPEIILTTQHSGLNPDKLGNKTGWEEVEAVQEDQVYVLPEDKVVRPGPRIIDGFEKIAEALHPDAFK